MTPHRGSSLSSLFLLPLGNTLLYEVLKWPWRTESRVTAAEGRKRQTPGQKRRFLPATENTWGGSPERATLAKKWGNENREGETETRRDGGTGRRGEGRRCDVRLSCQTEEGEPFWCAHPELAVNCISHGPCDDLMGWWCTLTHAAPCMSAQLQPIEPCTHTHRHTQTHTVQVLL